MSTDSHPALLGKFTRRFGMGKLLLRTRHFLQLGPWRRLRQARKKSAYLRRILSASPIPSEENAPEVHMLLQQSRVLEGLWAFYSLARFLPGGGRLVVHDDGSLSMQDAQTITSLFPDTVVIWRREADDIINHRFAANSLEQCRRLRDSLPFALKLFDVALLSRQSHVLLLDSDVLFFESCDEILSELARPPSERQGLYMRDVQDAYSLKPARIAEILGQPCIEAFNPGVALVSLDAININRLEAYLQRSEFWRGDGSPDYYAELTLWAMEFTLQNAQPLPSSYVVVPQHAGTARTRCIHYCGGIIPKNLFYTDGIPTLNADLQRRGLMQ